jgi:hypothetical protein
LQETARFCKTKNVNIRGTKSIKRFYIGDPLKNPSDLELYNDPEVYGYTKITEIEYKKQIKENNAKGKESFINKNNKLVRAIYIQGSFLKEEDVEGKFDPRDNSFYRSPEENMILNEMILENKSLESNEG